ncbi:MAG: hypothetical protein WDN29_06430 [Methylovirgula sp.]
MHLNQWGLTGNWTVGGERASLDTVGGKITLPFSRPRSASRAWARQGRQAVHFRVLVNGQAPGADHGVDIDAAGIGTVTEQRLYQLVRQSGPVQGRTFEIQFLDPGVEAFPRSPLDRRRICRDI